MNILQPMAWNSMAASVTTKETGPWINTMKGVVIYSSPITICCFDLANITLHKRANSSRVRKYSWKETFRCWYTCGELSEISVEEETALGSRNMIYHISLKSNMDTAKINRCLKGVNFSRPPSPVFMIKSYKVYVLYMIFFLKQLYLPVYFSSRQTTMCWSKPRVSY